MLCALTMCISMAARPQQRKGEWKEKMQQERIAYLTMAVDMTNEEAQAFWPVYNQIEKQREDARRAVFETFKKMDKAVENSGADASALLNDYLEAKAAADAIDATAAKEFSKVLPAEKVAKIFIGEENFRRDQMRKMHHGCKMKADGERKAHNCAKCNKDENCAKAVKKDKKAKETK